MSAGLFLLCPSGAGASGDALEGFSLELQTAHATRGDVSEEIGSVRADVKNFSLRQKAMLSDKHLTLIKDQLVLRYLLEHGGQLTMTYDELCALAREYDGYAVHLLCESESFTVTVHSPERVKQTS